MLVQNETQRRLATGDFRELARAMVVDPALLVWLDGDGSRAGKPNENLAREFLELFTLGAGAYTEDDVKAAARALTGWQVHYADGTVQLVGKYHNPGPMTAVGTTAAFDAPRLADAPVAPA